MIKCNVTVCGIINRDATTRTNKEGKPFFTFPLQIMVPATDGQEKPVEIDVSKDGGQEEASCYRKGSRVEIDGTMYLKHRGDRTYFNLFANEIRDVTADAANTLKERWFSVERSERTSRKRRTRKTSPTRCSRHSARRKSLTALSTNGYVSSASTGSVKNGSSLV